jgi:hypothetical protein
MKKVAVLTIVFLAALSLAQGATVKLSREPATEVKRGHRATDAPALSADRGREENSIDRINLAAEFGNIADADWSSKGNYSEATFYKNGNLLTTYFNHQGEIIGTTAEKKFTELPVSAQRVISSRYKDYKISNVIYFEDYRAEDTDGLIYGVKFMFPGNYFLEMTNADRKLILEVNPMGEVFVYKNL